jgi:integrase
VCVRIAFRTACLAARRKAGLPTAGADELRHLHASALIRAGLSVKAVSERLGHSNAAISLNVCSHLGSDDVDRSRQAIDDVFRRDVPTARPRTGS